MNSKLIILPFLGWFTLVGCNVQTTKDGEGFDCGAIETPALVIDVYDKETGLALLCGVTVSIRDGDFTQEQSMGEGEDCVTNIADAFSLARDREGQYDITVMKEGYVDWVQYDTVVSSNICTVNTIRVQAYMDK